MSLRGRALAVDCCRVRGTHGSRWRWCCKGAAATVALIGTQFALACTGARTDESTSRPIADQPDSVVSTETRSSAHRSSTLPRVVIIPEPIVVHPDVYEFQAIAINASDTLEIWLAGLCPITLRAYRDSSRVRLAWDAERAKPAGVISGCTTNRPEYRVLPRQRSRLGRVVLASAHILGDTLPEGRYYFLARLRYNGREWFVPAGSARLRR